MPIISGGGGGSGVGSILFASTLLADTASIDTGAGGIATGFNLLEVWIYARTDEGVTSSNVNVNVNNDTGANYDLQNISGVNASATAANLLAQTAWQVVLPGGTAAASYYGIFRIVIPLYSVATTGFKMAEAQTGRNDSTAALDRSIASILTWRSTAAITRMAVAPATGGAKLKTGSALLIWGR